MHALIDQAENTSGKVQPPITALLLAAGLGSRFQGHKMLHPVIALNGETLPMALASANQVSPHVHQVVCIVRPEDSALKNQLERAGYTTLDNPEYKSGMASSIVTGVSNIPADHHIMICLGDMPFIQGTTFETLLREFYECREEKITRPIWIEDQSPLNESATHALGHPVIFPSRTRNALLGLKGDNGAKSVMEQYGVQLVAVDDKGVTQDVDHLDMLAAL